METIFFQIGKEAVFPELLEDPAYGLHVRLPKAFLIDLNVVPIYNDEDVSFSALILLT